MKKLLPCFLSILLFIQCSENGKDTFDVLKIKDDKIVHADDIQAWQGLYRGTVPSKHSVGMIMNLALKANNKYDLNITFLEKNPLNNKTIKFDGDIKWDPENSIITLTEMDTLSNKFRVKTNRVEYLNPDETPNTGKLAEFFILKKEE